MSLEIRQVRGLRDLREFIALPYRLHAGAPWIPPLKLERYLFLIQPLNAYFKHADAAYFLARRDGRVVGRITAQVDRAYNEFHSNRCDNTIDDRNHFLHKDKRSHASRCSFAALQVCSRVYRYQTTHITQITSIEPCASLPGLA